MIPVFAQSTSLSGQWKGKIYQTNGTVKTEYQIELNLHHLPNKVVGRSYINAGDIFAEIKLIGTLNNRNLFTFKDTEIVHSQEGREMSWCMKSVKLKLSLGETGWELRGTWTGVNEYSHCNPGTLILTKVITEHKTSR